MRAASTRSIGRRTSAGLVGGVVAIALLGACSSDATDTTAGGAGSTTSTARAGTSSTTASTTSSTSSPRRTTSTTAATGSPQPTDVAAPVTSEVQLRGDGLGVAVFGEPEDAALASLTAALGPWTHDDGWRTADENILGVDNRMVAWGGLWVTITRGDAGPAFSSWRYTAEHAAFPGPTPDLAGPGGLRLGTTASAIDGLDEAEPVSGEGAVGYQLPTEDGPVNLWFDPPATASAIDPASTLVILDAGDTGDLDQA